MFILLMNVTQCGCRCRTTVMGSKLMGREKMTWRPFHQGGRKAILISDSGFPRTPDHIDSAHICL